MDYFPPDTRPRPMACEVMAYNDQQLDDYIKAVGRVLTIQDSHNLSESFIQRLRDRARPPKLSQPADLSQVSAKLQTMVDNVNRGQLQYSRLPTTPPPDDEGDLAREIMCDKQCYHILVEAGGRVTHPLDRLEDIRGDPGDCRDIVEYWKDDRFDHINNTWCGFEGQTRRWLEFRRVQRLGRGGTLMQYWRDFYNDELRFPHPNSCIDWPPKEFESYLEITKTTHNGLSMINHRVHGLRGIQGMHWLWIFFTSDTPPASLQEQQQQQQQHGFAKYTQALKERLVRNGYHEPFVLSQDWTAQDQLTTWIEYLGYEYLWDERYMREFHPLQQRFKKSWQKLVDANVLRPHDTQEWMRSMEASRADNEEESMTRRAAEDAAAAVSAVMNEIAALSQSHTNFNALQQRLLVLQKASKEADGKAAAAKHRNSSITDFVRSTTSYREAEKNLVHHRLLLRWVEEQIPLIEHEMDADKQATSTDAKPARKRKFTAFTLDDATNADKSLNEVNDSLKRVKREQVPDVSAKPRRSTRLERNQSLADNSSRPARTASSRQTVHVPKKDSRSVPRMLVRRSARIAQKEHGSYQPDTLIKGGRTHKRVAQDGRMAKSTRRKRRKA